ncbi:MAG TPA: NADH:ubiquinone oxidoreductase [Geobacteraceae bacterium]
MKKPNVAIAGLTACFGCQLTLLDCENELAAMADRFTFAYFPMGVTTRTIEGDFDAAFVEGAVSTPEDLEMLVHLRSRSRLLIALGTCARWGGIAGLKNNEPRLPLAETVYGGDAHHIDTFNPGPLHRFVSVDAAIVGCPPEKPDIIATLAALLAGTLPVFTAYPVCMECRERENLCLLIERNKLCLGPLIQSGCGARCPAAGMVCEGCRGPAAETNSVAQETLLREKGFTRDEIASRMRRFSWEWDHDQDH